MWIQQKCLPQCPQGPTRFRRRWFYPITGCHRIRLCGTFSEVLQEPSWRCWKIDTHCTCLDPIPIRTTIPNPLLAGHRHLIHGWSLFSFCHGLLEWNWWYSYSHIQLHSANTENTTDHSRNQLCSPAFSTKTNWSKSTMSACILALLTRVRFVIPRGRRSVTIFSIDSQVYTIRKPWPYPINQSQIHGAGYFGRNSFPPSPILTTESFSNRWGHGHLFTVRAASGLPIDITPPFTTGRAILGHCTQHQRDASPKLLLE